MKIYNVLIALAIAIAFMLFVRTYTGVKAADLANPGTLNLTQIDSYPVCSPSIPNSSSPSYSTCKVGEGSNWQGLLLAKSINQNEYVLPIIGVSRPSSTCLVSKPSIFAALSGNFPLGWWKTA